MSWPFPLRLLLAKFDTVNCQQENARFALICLTSKVKLWLKDRICSINNLSPDGDEER